jgi:hypothetical protein
VAEAVEPFGVGPAVGIQRVEQSGERDLIAGPVEPEDLVESTSVGTSELRSTRSSVRAVSREYP